jgi:hypothetical protein
VFGTVHRGDRGTILVDWSGSMSLTPRDIEKILAASPRMTIAAYSSRTYGYTEHRNTGELRILAHHGRMANPGDVKNFGHANGVDSPALRWLIKQPGPRFWISDGKVTGQHELVSGELQSECYKLCRDHNVKRFDDIPDFFEKKQAGVQEKDVTFPYRNRK